MNTVINNYGGISFMFYAVLLLQLLLYIFWQICGILSYFGRSTGRRRKQKKRTILGWGLSCVFPSWLLHSHAPPLGSLPKACILCVVLLYALLYFEKKDVTVCIVTTAMAWLSWDLPVKLKEKKKLHRQLKREWVTQKYREGWLFRMGSELELKLARTQRIPRRASMGMLTRKGRSKKE